VPVTSSDFVLTCDTFRDAQPHLEQTKQRGRDVLLPLLEAGVVPVVTGFIGATPDGRITTLGRNSPDFSEAIIAHVVDADELVIWSDVDGIYRENPNECAQATLLHDHNYDDEHTPARRDASVPGATGTVGQRLVHLLADHPWFELTEVAASERSSGKSYAEATRWHLETPIPDAARNLTVKGLEPALDCDFVFSGLDSSVAGVAEEDFARAGYPVVS